MAVDKQEALLSGEQGRLGVASFLGLSSAELSGIGLTLLGAFIYTVHDAAVKHMVVTLAVPQIIFVRCCTITLGCAFIGRVRLLREILKFPQTGTLMVRACLMLLSSFLYYSAARSLMLAELTTLYFVGPLFMVCLAYMLLKEPFYWAHVVAMLAGLAGVGVAVSPSLSASSGGIPVLPAACALGAALAWAMSMVLTRRIGSATSAIYQVAMTNLMIAVMAGAVVLPYWENVGIADMVFMTGIGAAAGLGQLTLTEAARRTSISVVAPFNYSTLIWAALLGYLIWGDKPTLPVLAGGALIVAGGVLVMLNERQIARLARFRR